MSFETNDMEEFKPGLSGFKPGRESDSDELAAGEVHVRPTNKNGSSEAPAGKWVDVPKGMIAVPGTYVDDHGVLRSVKDDSCVVWHKVWTEENGENSKNYRKVHCQRRGIHPSEIVYDPATGAPWCPECWERREGEKEENNSKVKAFLDNSEARN